MALWLDGCIWNHPQSYTCWLFKPWRWNKKIMEVLVQKYCHLATASARAEKHTLGFMCIVRQPSRAKSWPTFNPFKILCVRTSDSGRKNWRNVWSVKNKTGPFLEGRRSVESWHRQRAKALVDACHPPLRSLWLAFVVLETANSCMQMALFPQSWPPLFCAWVWQGRFLCSIKEGVAFSQIRVSPPWPQQEFFKIVCLFRLFYSWYYW